MNLFIILIGDNMKIFTVLIKTCILTATTNAKKKLENSNILKENCNIFKIDGSFSNGNILSVIITLTKPAIKENI